MTYLGSSSHAPAMLRTHTYLLGAVLLALGVVVVLMVAGLVPAGQSSVLGALIAGEPRAVESQPVPAVTPIEGPIIFDGLRPGETDTFGLREGLVIVHAQYDGIAEPFSAFLRALNDAQPETITPISIIPPLDRQGAASGQVTKAGRFVLTVERAEGEWAVTISQPS